MVANLTLGNQKWIDGWKSSEAALVLANSVTRDCAKLATEDSDSFDNVMAAFRLPKNTDKEKSFRRDTIRKSTLIAAEIP